MANAVSNSFTEGQPQGNLPLTGPSIPCNDLFNPFKDFPRDLICGILEYNLAAAPLVCRDFRDISQDGVLSNKIFNGFSKHIQEAIREKSNRRPPERQLPVTAPQLQILAYSILSQELTDIGLDPAAIKFTQDDLASYRAADRLIKAKNFCLFCSKIPGITVNTEKLDTKEGILEQKKLCRQQFNTLDLTTINSLNFRGLGLTRLPIEIGQLTALDWLNLKNNRLTALPESFGNLAALQSLNLDNNLLTALPASFGQLAALRWLYLENNLLTALPESFRNLAALQTLNLKNNRLTALPASFGNLVALEWLFLNNNLLTALPESFGQLAALQLLRLSNNLLTALPNTLFELHIQTISFDGNPLTFFQKQQLNYHFNPIVFQRDFSVGTAITAVVVCAVALSQYWLSFQTPAEEL